jgi:hypothetical protein
MATTTTSPPELAGIVPVPRWQRFVAKVQRARLTDVLLRKIKSLTKYVRKNERSCF